MRGIRQCRECDRTEIDTYLSGRLLCRDCARKRASAQSDLSFDLAEEMRYAPRDDFAAALAKSVRMMQRQYEEAQRRRAAEAAEREARRLAQIKPVRPPRRRTV